MRKIFLILLLATIWSFLSLGMKVANAGEVKSSEYNKAVIAHVIKEKISGNGVDHSALMKQELNVLVYAMTLEMANIIEKHLPYILEGLASEIRQNADNEYKCSLLKDTNVACN
tara:strand:+ start:260 stop:601 length:342 start_codon:yes stop_codon:yes gene_type:complete